MAQVSTQQINVSHLLVAMFFMMLAAGAFVVIVTNTLVNSQVNALSGRLAAQHNPVTVTPAAQTNVAPDTVCVDPSAADDEGHVLGASTGEGAAVFALAQRAAGRGYLPLASISYNQSNSSTTTTSSTNTFIKDSYNSSRSESSRVLITNNGNTDNRHSGNTANVTLTDNRNSGNTSNTSTTNNTTTNTTNTTTVIRDNNKNNGNTSDSNNDNSTNVDVEVEVEAELGLF